MLCEGKLKDILPPSGKMGCSKEKCCFRGGGAVGGCFFVFVFQINTRQMYDCLLTNKVCNK